MRTGPYPVCIPPAQMRESPDPLIQLVRSLHDVQSALHDAMVMSNPFALLGSSSMGGMTGMYGILTVTPGTVVSGYKNNQAYATLFIAQAQGTSTALRSYLFLSKDPVSTTQARARVRVYDIAPRASILLLPNEEAFVDTTDPDNSSPAAAQNVQWSAVALRSTGIGGV